MGSSVSRPTPLSAPFQRMQSWDLKAARRLLQDYKDKDLDFGLDTQAMGELIQGDTEWAETIISAFGSNNGIVNALAFICGVCLVCSGPALEKAAMVFDALDFDATEQISMDEMTIVFLCCARGFCVISGVGSVPSDEALETVTVQAYRELNKSSTQSIAKAEFTTWTLRFAAAGASGEVTVDQMAQQFGITSPPSQKEEEAAVAASNNDVDVQAPSDAVHEAQAHDAASPDTAGEEQAEVATELLETGEACVKKMPPEPTPADEQTPDKAQPSELSPANEKHELDTENQEQPLPTNEERESAVEEPDAQSYEHEEEHAYADEPVGVRADSENAETLVADQGDPHNMIEGNHAEAELLNEETATDEAPAPAFETKYHEEQAQEESYESDHEQSFAAEDQAYAEDPMEQSVANEEEAEQQPDYELEFSTETPRPDDDAEAAEQVQPQEPPAADAYGDGEHEYYDDESEAPTPRPDGEIPQPEPSVETPAEAAAAEPTISEPAAGAEGTEEHEQYEYDHAEPTPRQAEEEDPQPESSTEIPRADKEIEAPQDPVAEPDMAHEHYQDDPEASTSPQTDEDPQLEGLNAEPSDTNEDLVDAEAAHYEDEAYEETSFAAESTAIIQDEEGIEHGPADGIPSSRSDASDLNQFDQYDYTDPKYSAESGLPPPEDELLLSARSDASVTEEKAEGLES